MAVNRTISRVGVQLPAARSARPESKRLQPGCQKLSADPGQSDDLRGRTDAKRKWVARGPHVCGWPSRVRAHASLAIEEARMSGDARDRSLGVDSGFAWARSSLS